MTDLPPPAPLPFSSSSSSSSSTSSTLPDFALLENLISIEANSLLNIINNQRHSSVVQTLNTIDLLATALDNRVLNRLEKSTPITPEQLQQALQSSADLWTTREIELRKLIKARKEAFIKDPSIGPMLTASSSTQSNINEEKQDDDSNSTTSEEQESTSITEKDILEYIEKTYNTIMKQYIERQWSSLKDFEDTFEIETTKENQTTTIKEAIFRIYIDSITTLSLKGAEMLDEKDFSKKMENLSQYIEANAKLSEEFYHKLSLLITATEKKWIELKDQEKLAPSSSSLKAPPTEPTTTTTTPDYFLVDVSQYDDNQDLVAFPNSLLVKLDIKRLGTIIGRGASGSVFLHCTDNNKCDKVIKIGLEYLVNKRELDIGKRAGELGFGPKIFTHLEQQGVRMISPTEQLLPPVTDLYTFIIMERLEDTLTKALAVDNKGEYYNFFLDRKPTLSLPYDADEIFELSMSFFNAHFTHEDLHTDNIMYRTLDNQKKRWYFIDFGRSLYKPDSPIDEKDRFSDIWYLYQKLAMLQAKAADMLGGDIRKLASTPTAESYLKIISSTLSSFEKRLEEDVKKSKKKGIEYYSFKSINSQSINSLPLETKNPYTTIPLNTTHKEQESVAATTTSSKKNPIPKSTKSPKKEKQVKFEESTPSPKDQPSSSIDIAVAPEKVYITYRLIYYYLLIFSRSRLQ